MSNSLIVPVVLWGKHPPTHRICSILITPDFKTIVTGCRDGQLCTWNITSDSIVPESMLFGHSASVKSIAAVVVEENRWKKKQIISASVNGEIYLWDLVDGKCLEQSTLPGSPVGIQTHAFTINGEAQPCVVCYGQFTEVFVLSASTLSVQLTLFSRILPDWISCACVVPHKTENGSDNVICITAGGMIKVWHISKSSAQPRLNENESKQITYSTTVDIVPSKVNPALLLVVSSQSWQVCDSGDYSVLSCAAAGASQQWMGGDFVAPDMIAMWTRKGEVVTFRLPFDARDVEPYRNSLKCDACATADVVQSAMLVESQQYLLPPAFKIYHHDERANLFVGDCNGVVTMSEFSSEPVRCKTNMTASLRRLWASLNYTPAGIVDQLNHNIKEPLNVTASLFVFRYCYLCCGREDGSIVVVSASKTCKAHLLQDEYTNRKGWPPHRTLRGHRDRVTCLMYPHQDTAHRYGSEILVSGSADFSVLMWDLFAGTLLHSFSVHGGEITQLIIPPEGCNQRVRTSVCSVGSDHSVALLNLRDRKCVLLASRHPSPITAIRWRPDDDFLIVSCSDLTVFVWQMETGHLDRFEQGTKAADVIAGCDEIENGHTDLMVQNTTNISHALKNPSLSAFKAIAEQSLKSLIDGADAEKQEQNEVQKKIADEAYKAMVVSSFRSSALHDSDSHIVFFNTEALIAKLLTEQKCKCRSRSHKNNLQAKRHHHNMQASPGKKMISSLIRQVKHQFLDDTSDTSAAESPLEVAATHKKSPLEVDSALDISQIAISLLHAWALDAGIDRSCRTRLGLLLPKNPVCFGLLSRGGSMSLLLPRPKPDEGNDEGTTGHSWKVSSSLTTQHLLSIIAIANTMMELPNACFTHKVAPARKHNNDTTTDSDDFSRDHLDSMEQSQVKQSWSLLATLHCVLLPEKISSDAYKPPKLELLARRWQDRCLEIREASQALMLAEMRQIGAEGRRRVVEAWCHHVPDYVQHGVSHEGDAESGRWTTDDACDRSSVASDELIAAQLPSSADSSKLSYEVRRRHATAIVILGVVGAEFGQELEPRRASNGNSRHVIPDGFGIHDYSLARHTCRALVYLLLQPPSAKLPAHIPIRRAAIDLIGRGFTVWEPYMEVSAVLLGLLELCENYSRHLGSIQSGLPLAADADSCRSAHHALSLIATARPLTFVTTIAREVARHNAAAANPQHQALLAASVLARAKPEVLRIVELLADKMMFDLHKVLVEVVDIVLFCIDVSQLRASYGLLEAVPALAKFHSVSYDARSRRVAVAANHGRIVLYDVRTCKHQVVAKPESSGGGAISALCFSPEGKYLAVYSHDDQLLTFWQTATSLFGMLQSQVKCVKTCQVALKLPQVGNGKGMIHSKLFPPKLVWVNNRVVVLLSTDGCETRFHI